MPALKRKPLGEGNTYADEVMRAWDRLAEHQDKPCPRCGGTGEVMNMEAGLWRKRACPDCSRAA